MLGSILSRRAAALFRTGATFLPKVPRIFWRSPGVRREPPGGVNPTSTLRRRINAMTRRWTLGLGLVLALGVGAGMYAVAKESKTGSNVMSNAASSSTLASNLDGEWQIDLERSDMPRRGERFRRGEGGRRSEGFRRGE